MSITAFPVKPTETQMQVRQMLIEYGKNAVKLDVLERARAGAIAEGFPLKPSATERLAQFQRRQASLEYKVMRACR